jgi:hypothetical protein
MDRSPAQLDHPAWFVAAGYAPVLHTMCLLLFVVPCLVVSV